MLAPVFVEVTYGDPNDQDAVVSSESMFEQQLSEILVKAMSFNGVNVSLLDLVIHSTPHKRAHKTFDVEVHITTMNSKRRVDNAGLSPQRILKGLYELYPHSQFCITVQPTIAGLAMS
jgi:hypothetical protein